MLLIQCQHLTNAVMTRLDDGLRRSGALIDSLRLIAIADGEKLKGRDYITACKAAAQGGATAIQVRLKTSDLGTVLSITEQLVGELNIPVFVNDRADVALLCSARGVHLGSEDVPVDVVRRIAAPAGLTVGASVGNAEEAHEAIRGGADYWGIGPIFPTPTKSDAGAAIGPAGFSRLRALAPEGVAVVGVGGITADNCSQVIGVGADGVAVISGIFSQSDIKGATQAVRRAVDRALGKRG